MFISEQMKQAIIEAVLPKLAETVVGMLPKEDLAKAINLAQTLPEEYQAIRGQLNRIEQNQEDIMRHLGVERSARNAEMDDRKQPALLRA